MSTEYRVVEWHDGQQADTTEPFATLAEAERCIVTFEQMGSPPGIAFSFTIEARQVDEWRPLS